MTRRKLTAEEIDLWHRVVEKAERLQPPSIPHPPLPKPKPKKTVIGRRTDLPERTPALARVPAATVSNFRVTSAVQMDRRAFDKMKRGKLAIDGRIDLHGMTLDRAHPTLTQFILSSQAAGRRLVLVITGKGKAFYDHDVFPAQRGILAEECSDLAVNAATGPGRASGYTSACQPWW